MILILLVSTINMMSQTGSSEKTTYAQKLVKLDKLIGGGDFEKAYDYTLSQIDSILVLENYYYVTDYTYYLGRITKELYGKEPSIKALEDFEKKFISVERDSAKAMRQLQLEKAVFYEYIGDSKKAEECNQKALEYTERWSNATGKDFGLVYSNLGILNVRLGLLSEGVFYQKKSLKAYQAVKDLPANYLYNIYNNLGGAMWYQSKMDSAAYYFSEAEKKIDAMESNPWNQYYRKATVQNNIAGVYSLQGKTNKAAKTMEKAIHNLNTFVTKDVKDYRRDQGYTFLFQTIENYGGLFKQLGDYERALDILEYAYNRKQDYFDSSNSELANAKIYIANAHIDLKNYKKAEALLQEAISDLESGSSFKDIYAAATAYYYKARSQENRSEIEGAFDDYAQSKKLFILSQSNGYDEVYIAFTRNAANFYAKNGKNEQALEMANQSYKYLKENQGSSTLLQFDNIINLSTIYYELGLTDEANAKVKEATQILDELVLDIQDANLFRHAERRAELSVLQTKIMREGDNGNNVDALVNQLKNLEGAIRLLEYKKSFVYSNEDNALLLERNQELFQIAKEITLQLYKQTKDKDYIKKLLNFHESNVYHRIRSRINMRKNVQFNKIPEEVIVRGEDIRTNISELFMDSENNENVISQFTILNDQWKSYLDTLREQYPDYYNMRYASIDTKIDNMSVLVPENYTLIRYIVVGNVTYALVIDKNKTSMVEVNLQKATPIIFQLQKNQFNEKETLDDLHQLYNLLWKPFEKEISTENVIIIPDGILYNLSFESLLIEASSVYKDVINKSLLANYTIAYNYSALLANIQKNNSQKSSFIAFTPEFSESMKEDYRIAVSDSITLDKGYLKLLPQPFSADLAENYNNVYNGDHFRNKNATKQLFVKEAGEHKIIHIGTHAESNNISPELSRLIFAKPIGVDLQIEDNSLYSFEIYNCNLTSNLAILTACETGKPSYQSGEGMISLAHAFNYAGSESILTSLWKIDEQSSAKIVGYFYENLNKGLPKDQAIKDAKLKYLSTANGRTLHPNYWAGLVLIGDTSPLELSSVSYLTWILICLASITFLLLLFKFFKDKQRH